MLTAAAVLCALFATLLFAFAPAMRSSDTWRATVTPLASIIGSGFLVVGPLLTHSVGRLAAPVVLLIVAVAYWIGNAIRFNIVHLEPLLAAPSPPRFLSECERASHLALAFAYVISVSFYLQLLAAFLLRGLGANAVWNHVIASALLVGIGVVGWWRGLQMLEFLEEYAVNIKLSIIAGLLVGLAIVNGLIFSGHRVASYPSDQPIDFHVVRMVMGSLIIVQGFETSRFLGEAYNARKRVETMRYAQWISAFIYVAFLLLITPVSGSLKSLNDTAIIDLSRIVTPILPWMLIVAAIMSQFSAAVADTLGGGGLIAEGTRNWVASRRAYAVIAGLGLVVTWLTNTFEVISLASRAFAFYYMLQSLEATVLAFGQKELGASCRTNFFLRSTHRPHARRGDDGNSEQLEVFASRMPVISSTVDPYAKPKEKKTGAQRPKVSHLPSMIDPRTRNERKAEKQAVAAARRAIKKSARQHLKREMMDELPE